MDPFANIVGYAYNARGDRTQIIYPGNLAVSYTFDADGHMLSLSDWMGNSVSYSYDPSGRPVTVTNANATITSYAYQFGNRLSVLGNATSDGTVINSYQYSLGRRRQPGRRSRPGARAAGRNLCEREHRVPAGRSHPDRGSGRLHP
jgi:YD repeat-containing protein